MREIKFRTWDKANKIMSLVYRLLWFAYDPGKYDITIFADEKDWEREPDLVLMQYTGLKDKNGVEVYEGDIINYYRHYSSGAPKACEIRWDGYGACWGAFWNDESRHTLHVSNELEVIGNIYEHGHLLEK